MSSPPYLYPPRVVPLYLPDRILDVQHLEVDQGIFSFEETPE